MAFPTPSFLPRDPHSQILVVGVSLTLIIGIIFAATFIGKSSKSQDGEQSTIEAFMRFIYGCFLKPHTGDSGNGQQDALESFYKAQAAVYDKTRTPLLRGREDMLGLVAAQLVQKAARGRSHNEKRIWVDVSHPDPFILTTPNEPWLTAMA